MLPGFSKLGDVSFQIISRRDLLWILVLSPCLCHCQYYYQLLEHLFLDHPDLQRRHSPKMSKKWTMVAQSSDSMLFRLCPWVSNHESPVVEQPFSVPLPQRVFVWLPFWPGLRQRVSRLVVVVRKIRFPCLGYLVLLLASSG